MVRRGGRVRRAFRRAGSRVRRAFRRSSKAQRGILPTMMGVSAALVPLTRSLPSSVDGAQRSPVTALRDAMESGDFAGAIWAVSTIGENVIANLPTEVELAGGAILTNWAAKKSGARNATRVSKHWSAL